MHRRMTTSAPSPKPTNASVDGSGTKVDVKRIGSAVQPGKLARGAGANEPVTPEKTGVDAYQYPENGPVAFAKLPAPRFPNENLEKRV